MTDNHEPQVTTSDQPLLVLKYRRGHAISTIVCFTLLVLLFSGTGVAIIAFASKVPAKQEFVLLLFSGLYIGLLPLILAPGVVDRLSFKEIRLYQDRIVRVGIHGGEKAISLACAKLQPMLRYQGAILCHQDTKWFLRPFKCIRYSEEYADPKDAIRLKHMLASLSGRQVRELGPTGSMNPWMKLTDRPRVVSQSTLDSIDKQVLREYLEERKYNRSELKAIIVTMIFCVLLPGFLAGFGIWWSLK
jgi:hypothetical protein